MTILFALIFDIIVALGFLSLKQFSLLTLGNLLVILILARFDYQIFPSMYALYNVVFINILGALVAMIFLRYKTISEMDRQRRLTTSEARYRVISELSSDFSRSEILTPDGTFSIEWLSEAIEQITVYNYSGKTVFDQTINKHNKFVLNTATFHTGVYIVKIKTGTQEVFKRFVIVR